MTICTAMASPMARPIPSTTAVSRRGDAAGIRTRQMLCQRVEPRAKAPSLRVWGRASKASMLRLTMVGTIITIRMQAAAKKPEAGLSFSHLALTSGSRKVSPKMP